MSTFIAPMSPFAPAPRVDYKPTWPFVRRRFETFRDNLMLTRDQVRDGDSKVRRVVRRLNREYWNLDSDIANAVPTGAWAKGTRRQPPRDMDMLFLLPVQDFQRFKARVANGQSQLLQDVKEVLLDRDPRTDIRGDEQAVVVGFNSYSVEVVPAIQHPHGGFIICDTANSGRIMRTHPVAEIALLDRIDRVTNGNARIVIGMMKEWQRVCDVPLKSFMIERLVMEALRRMPYGHEDEFWFDWIVRDVFGHMIRRAGGSFHMPGTGQHIELGQN